jgi:hypothetical protein
MPSILRNLNGGDYSPLERARKIAANTLRKVVRRQTCCGNYGEPGC